MLTQSYCSSHEQNVILFAPTSTDVLDDADQLDEAGQCNSGNLTHPSAI